MTSKTMKYLSIYSDHFLFFIRALNISSSSFCVFMINLIHGTLLLLLWKDFFCYCFHMLNLILLVSRQMIIPSENEKGFIFSCPFLTISFFSHTVYGGTLVMLKIVGILETLVLVSALKRMFLKFLH